jgi:hypothetical protein
LRVALKDVSTAGLGQTATALCPSGLTPIGSGWFQTDPTFDADHYITRSTISTDPDPGVTAAAVSLGTSRAWGLTAEAVCDSRA